MSSKRAITPLRCLVVDSKMRAQGVIASPDKLGTKPPHITTPGKRGQLPHLPPLLRSQSLHPVVYAHQLGWNGSRMSANVFTPVGYLPSLPILHHQADRYPGPALGPTLVPRRDMGHVFAMQRGVSLPSAGFSTLSGPPQYFALPAVPATVPTMSTNAEKRAPLISVKATAAGVPREIRKKPSLAGSPTKARLRIPQACEACRKRKSKVRSQTHFRYYE